MPTDPAELAAQAAEEQRARQADYEKTAKTLDEQLTGLRKALLWRKAMNRGALATGLIVALVGIVSTSLFDFQHPQQIVLAAVVIAVTAVALPIAFPTSELDARIFEVRSQIDLNQSGISLVEKRAVKVFELHQHHLKQYYDQILWHSAWIFVVGILCLLLGFAIIGIGFYLIYTQQATTTEKVIVVAFSTAGGLLADFIAVMYLQMHAKTIQTLTEFHQRYVATNHLLFANFLASKSNDAAKQSDSFMKMAETIVTNFKPAG